MKKIDIANQKFGRLTALSRVKGSKWKCKCECGNIVYVRTNSLIQNYTLSCGCYHKDKLKEINARHNLSNARIYHIWQNIKRRCYNQNYKYYSYYGKKGITMCDEWKSSFESFYEWSMSAGYSDKLTIDRINSNGNYEPNNCRLVTRKEQQNNISSNLNFTIDGKTKTLAQWCEIYNVPHERTRYRVKNGWDILSALTTPPNQSRN